MSFHPTTSDKEVKYIVDAINQVTENITEWAKEYRFNPASGDFEHQESAVTYPSINDFQPLALNSTERSENTSLQESVDDLTTKKSPSLLKKIFG